MGRKTLISLNLQKYVEKYSNGPQWVHSTAKHEIKVSCNTDYIVPDLIDFSGDH